MCVCAAPVQFVQVLVAYNILKELLYLVLVQQYVMLYKSLCLNIQISLQQCLDNT